MSRTDDVRARGQERGGTGGGGGSPFIKWGDEYRWVEGKVTSVWEGKYGYSATMDVTDVAAKGLEAVGRDEDGNKTTERVRAGMEVNVGLNSSTLEGKIVPDDVGKAFHVAFEGWEQAKGGGNRYRIFTVIELTERDAPKDNPDPEDTTDYPEDDDGLPF